MPYVVCSNKHFDEIKIPSEPFLIVLVVPEKVLYRLVVYF